MNSSYETVLFLVNQTHILSYTIWLVVLYLRLLRLKSVRLLNE